MIVDSSAVVGIILREPRHEALLEKLAQAGAVGMGAPSLAETGIVLAARLSMDPRGLLGRVLQEFSVEVLPFTEAHWGVALDAFSQFGKGRHPAGLNFGDCMAYAMAAVARQPLLCVGNDFAKTDILLA